MARPNVANNDSGMAQIGGKFESGGATGFEPVALSLGSRSTNKQAEVLCVLAQIKERKLRVRDPHALRNMRPEADD